VGPGRFRTNSIHHQGLKDVAPSLVVEATSEDGIIEAVRLDRDDVWCLGVQWHPEFRRPEDDHLLDDTPVRAALLDRARRCAREAEPCGS
jgi:putative glutamine amidotransferase